jgi:hypothetical protein
MNPYFLAAIKLEVNPWQPSLKKEPHFRHNMNIAYKNRSLGGRTNCVDIPATFSGILEYHR